MPVDWSLARAPQGGMLNALKAYELGGAMRRQQVVVQREDEQFARKERQREALGRAIDPVSGNIDPRAAASAYAEGGDLEGLLSYRKTLQGQQAEHAKIIGRLAQGAKDQATWTAGLQRAVQLGAVTAEETTQFAEFTPQTRAAAMALGGIDEEEYTLAPGATRMRGGEVVASSPYKPEIITGEDGAKYVFNPNGDAAPGTGAPNIDAVFEALIQQESGGRPGILGQPTRYGTAVGMTQMLPGTAQEMARKLGVPWRPDLMRGKTEEAAQYQRTLGKAYFEEGLEKGGGDLREALKYYHGGPDKRLHGPRTNRYADEVLARVGGGAVPPGGARQITGPKPKDAPSGYRWKSDGTLEPIPGGPGDKSSVPGVDRKGEAALRKEFDQLPEIKSFNTVRGQYAQIRAYQARPSAQNDIAMIFSFMKMLDPTSVVREGEFATAQNAAGVPDRVRNAYNKAQSGQRLNAGQRAEMVRSAEATYLAQRRIFNERAKQYQGYARDSGFNPNRVAREYVEKKRPPAPKASPAKGWGKAKRVN